MYTRYRIFILLILSLALLSFNHLSAQTLTTDFHKPLVTDSLLIYKLPYIHASDTGRNCFWDFSAISTDSANCISVDYYVSLATDTTYMGLHRERANYYYHFLGDTLWLIGYESSRTHVRYSRPISLIRYPFHFRDSICCTVSGTGQYCHFLPLAVEGSYSAHAEATGRLLLPGMIVDSALLIHVKTSLHETNQVQNCVQEDIRRWYSPYCRYPLFETKHIQTISNGDTITCAFSYFYPQEEHISEKIEDVLQNNSANPKDSIVTNVTYLPNPVSTNLRINYSLSQAANVYISLHYNGGISTYQTPIHQEDEGEHATMINMGGMPIGTYVVYIHADDAIVSGNIIKL